ncbi:MAG TPA: OmpH family outer membrane protein [Alphaproteobacteria bacterium]|nr:OmpH family outer membrane protein [Alphaproteobacteria bacterium]
MLNKLILSLAAVCIIATPAMAEDVKKPAANFAVVDVQLILTESVAAKNIQKQLQTKRDALQKEFVQHEEKLRADEKALAAEKGKLDEAAFKAKRDEFEKKLMETQGLVQKKKRDLEQAVLDSTGVLREALLKITAEIADEKKFDVVLNRQTVVIADKSLDITQAVLDKLNAKLTEVPLKAKKAD